jgi:hypothetical protein
MLGKSSTYVHSYSSKKRSNTFLLWKSAENKAIINNGYAAKGSINQTRSHTDAD